MHKHQLNQENRLDLYVYNEATAWTLSSRQLLADDPIPEDEEWDDAVAEGRLLVQGVYQDDSFHVRVVLGELQQEEDESWLGRVSWWLQVPDGELVIAAGTEFVMGMSEGMEDDEYIQVVAVPPGNYRVDIYSTLSGINGLDLLERAGGNRALGEWWRRTRNGEDMPDWLQFLLLDNLAEDPGHEEDWQNWSQARHRNLMHAVEHGGWIDWIVQLRPLAGDPPTDLPEMDEGCFYEPELRLPEKCPRCIAGNPVNAPEQYEEEAPTPVSVLERLTGIDPLPLRSGSVSLPAREVEIAARLAWFANRDVNAEILVEGPDLGDWAEAHLPTEEVFLRTAPDGRFRIGFAENEAVYDYSISLQRIGDALAALPDGSSLELLAAADGSSAEGRLRLSGCIQKGAWKVDAAAPETDAETLQAALVLAREADGDTVTLLDEGEKELVQQRWRDEGMQRTSPLVCQGLNVRHDEGSRFTWVIAATVFAVRFGTTWPCPEAEDPLAEFDVDLDENLYDMLLEGELPEGPGLLDAESGRSYYDVDDDDLPPEVQDRTGPALSGFAAAGAVAIGNLACSFSPQLMIRAVADKQARWYGTVMVVPYAGEVLEAYTVFADGSSLTTTTNPNPGGAAPGAEVYWNLLPVTAGAEELVAAHLSAIETHASGRETSVQLVRQNLLGLCEAIEEFLLRRTGQ